jgi:RND family efflux transporter MFP subunit
MFILRNKIILNLILITVLLNLTAVLVFAETVEYEGIIEPYKVIDIGAPVEGVVSEVTVDRSSLIKAEQILVKMESSVERAELEKAKAMATFDSEIKLQRTELAFAKRVNGRVKRLEASAKHDKDLAATEIIRARDRLKKAYEKSALAKFELKKAQAILDRCSIRSPISGVVVERYVSEGEYVNSQPLLRVAQIDPLRVEVIVPSQMFGRISTGMHAKIIPELPEYGEQTATVTIVDKVIDGASSTFGVRLELPNAENQIPSGMKCSVRFEVNQNADALSKVTDHIGPVGKQNRSNMNVP